jgi:hypothetical protein
MGEGAGVSSDGFAAELENSLFSSGWGRKLGSFGILLVTRNSRMRVRTGEGTLGSADGFAAEGESQLVFFGLGAKIGFVR